MSTLKTNIELFAELVKMDASLGEALKAFRSAGLHQQANVVARHLFGDSMVPKMGNKMAYNDHLGRHGNDGTHVHVDMNDFGQINKLHGEKHGDEAIKTFGNIAAGVSREFGGKAFRNGGDEFKFWFPKPEQAHGFARQLRSHLEKQPKIGGTHNLAASVGIGHNPDHAEHALLGAKAQLGPMDATGKRKNLHSMGNAPTVINALTHEPTPQGWKSGRGKADAPSMPAPNPNAGSMAPHGLKLHNPLTPKLPKL